MQVVSFSRQVFFSESLLTVSPVSQFLCKNQYSSLRIKSMILSVSMAAETAKETALTTKREIFIYSPPSENSCILFKIILSC